MMGRAETGRLMKGSVRGGVKSSKMGILESTFGSVYEDLHWVCRQLTKYNRYKYIP